MTENKPEDFSDGVGRSKFIIEDRIIYSFLELAGTRSLQSMVFL